MCQLQKKCTFRNGIQYLCGTTNGKKADSVLCSLCSSNIHNSLLHPSSSSAFLRLYADSVHCHCRAIETNINFRLHKLKWCITSWNFDNFEFKSENVMRKILLFDRKSWGSHTFQSELFDMQSGRFRRRIIFRIADQFTEQKSTNTLNIDVGTTRWRNGMEFFDLYLVAMENRRPSTNHRHIVRLDISEIPWYFS